MAEFEVEDAGRSGSIPVLPSPSGAPVMTGDERVALQGYLSELDQYYAAMNLFHEQEPDTVLTQCSAFLARLTEIRARLQRTGTARSTQLRTREIDPLMDQLDMQFKIHSRLLSVRDLDFRLSGGQT